MSADIRIVFFAYPSHFVDFELNNFFTDKEGPDSETITNIVEAINTRALATFICASGIHAIEMKNVTYILCKKSGPHPIEDGESTTSLKFTFSNVSAITIKCPITDMDSDNPVEFAKRTIEKCKIIGKTLTFSNGEKTIIINRRFLTSVYVNR